MTLFRQCGVSPVNRRDSTTHDTLWIVSRANKTNTNNLPVHSGYRRTEVHCGDGHTWSRLGRWNLRMKVIMKSNGTWWCGVVLVAWYDAYWKVTMPYKYVLTGGGRSASINLRKLIQSGTLQNIPINRTPSQEESASITTKLADSSPKPVLSEPVIIYTRERVPGLGLQNRGGSVHIHESLL